MDILYAGWSLLNPKGGGEISALSLLKKLSKKHNITAIGIGGKKEEIKKHGIHFIEYELSKILKKKIMPFHLQRLLWEEYFEKIIKEHLKRNKADLIIFQNPGNLKNKKIAKNAKIIFFIRTMQIYAIEDEVAFKLKRIYNLPFYLLKHKRNKDILKKADLVISNSNFIKNKIKKSIDLESKVIYPFVDTKKYKYDKKENEKKFITFINLSHGKGGEIALKIAEKMPEKDFLFIAGRNPEQKFVLKAKKLKNIKLETWVNNMSEIYQKTRLLLVPSIWEEPFGRIPIEAGINGIPTIASNRGGLKESVGIGGISIDDIWDINKWTTSIKKMDDEEYYKEKSTKSIKHSKEFDKEESIKKLKDIVRKELNIDI